jgi:antitoxin FitA
MSTSICIGEVPDEVRDELSARAALSGCTVEEYIREELIALARRPSAAVWMARVRARKDALKHQSPAALCNTESCNTESRNSESRNSESRNSESRSSDESISGSGSSESAFSESCASESESRNASESDDPNGGLCPSGAERGSEPRASQAPLAAPRRDVG